MGRARTGLERRSANGRRGEAAPGGLHRVAAKVLGGRGGRRGESGAGPAGGGGSITRRGGAMGERGAGNGIRAGGKEPATEVAQGTRGRRAGGDARRGCGLGKELQESEEKERERGGEALDSVSAQVNGGEKNKADQWMR